MSQPAPVQKAVPPSLPRDELVTLCGALLDYADAYDDVSGTWYDAGRIANDLYEAARHLRGALDYFGKHQTPPWSVDDGFDVC